MSGPYAGTSNGSLIETTRSGGPSCQPGVNGGIDGSFAGSPSGIFASTHRVMVSISDALRRLSPSYGKSLTTAFQGGIARELTAFAISVPLRFTSSYVRSENGAASPGRRQVAHLFRTIGATSSVNVTDSFACTTDRP